MILTAPIKSPSFFSFENITLLYMVIYENMELISVTVNFMAVPVISSLMRWRIKL